MNKILMSIHLEFVERICKGIKKWEYRKVLPKGQFDTIVIYSTYPVKQVIGEVEFRGYCISSPEIVWQMTSTDSGIDKEQYFSYFRDCKEAIAYKLGKVTIYNTPKSLTELGLDNAPQSFVYLK